MNNCRFKTLLAASAFLLAAAAGPMPAAAGTLDFNGRGASSAWGYDAAVYNAGGELITDLFGDATKSLSSGDEVTIGIGLNNNSPDDVTFWLRAWVPASQDRFTLEGDFEDTQADPSLMNVIGLEVKNPVTGQTIYKGPFGGDGASPLYSGSGGYGVQLGRVLAGWRGVIRVTLSVPELGNEHRNKLAAIHWALSAEQWTEDSPGVPDLTDKRSEWPGGEYEVELAPATGDESGLMRFSTVAAISLAGLVWLYITPGKSARKEAQ
jgi:hypothetical protein